MNIQANKSTITAFYDLMFNQCQPADPDATRRVLGAFKAYFPADRIRETGPTPTLETGVATLVVASRAWLAR